MIINIDGKEYEASATNRLGDHLYSRDGKHYFIDTIEKFNVVKEKITLFSCECGRDDCEDCSYDY